MDKLSEFGKTIGYLTAPYVVILRGPSSPRRKTARSTLYGPTRPGISTHLTSLFLPSSRTFFKVFWWPALLGLLTTFYGPTIKVCVSSSLHQNFFSTTSRRLGTKAFGIGYGPPLAPKRFKSSSRRLCATDSPPKHTYHLDVRLWILAALDANHQKLLYTFFVTVLGRKRYGTNPQVSCPCPSSICRYKIG